jgi:hypothetical protein
VVLTGCPAGPPEPAKDELFVDHLSPDRGSQALVGMPHGNIASVRISLTTATTCSSSGSLSNGHDLRHHLITLLASPSGLSHCNDM